jgi:integrase
VADAEKVFMMIRSNMLTTPQVFKIVEKYLDDLLIRHDKQYEDMLEIRSPEHMRKHVTDIANSRIELNSKHLSARTHVQAREGKARELLEKHHIDFDENSPEFKLLCLELVKASITHSEILKSRSQGGIHTYETGLNERRSSSTLKEAMNLYVGRRVKSSKARSLAKLPEKFSKIHECFEYETGDKEIFLSAVDYPLTMRVAERLKKYPSYRNTRHAGKSLDEIYQLENVQYSSFTTVDEEIKLLSSLYCFAIEQLNGLDRNYADGLSKVVLGKSTIKESEFRDLFRPEDINEILSGLMKLKRSFHLNPHLYLIPLIALYSGMRVNEICQLYLDDIKLVGGFWCFDNNEDKVGKSLKNANSKRINPIHPDLIKIGLISFCEHQKAKGYTRMWEGVQKNSCDFYEKQGNHSHYFDKWFNGTFKNHLKLSNPPKQTFHSFRHTFLDWFNQNEDVAKYWQAITALSGHLDEDDMRIFGIDPNSISRKRYSKELNVSKQLDALKLLNFGVDIKPLKLEFS